MPARPSLSCAAMICPASSGSVFGAESRSPAVPIFASSAATLATSISGGAQSLPSTTDAMAIAAAMVTFLSRGLPATTPLSVASSRSSRLTTDSSGVGICPVAAFSAASKPARL
eukprot:4108959-Prymnesium_polylepis.1